MKFLHRKPKHQHDWVSIGYGGAGWFLLECSQCGAKEIG